MNMLATVFLVAFASAPTSYEKQGMFYCNSEGIILEIEQGEFVTITLETNAPLFFRKSEIPKALLRKLNLAILGKKYKIFCVHSAYRADWQSIYDKYGRVTAKFVDIKKIE